MRMRNHWASVWLAALSMAFTSSLHAEDPVRPEKVATITGACERLVIRGKDLTAGCSAALVQSIYGSGRTGFTLTFGDPGSAVTFTGLRGAKPDANSQLQSVDAVILNLGVAPSTSAVSGSCAYGNPYSGPMIVSCQAVDFSGGAYLLQFRTDGSEPRLVDLSSPGGTTAADRSVSEDLFRCKTTTNSFEIALCKEAAAYEPLNKVYARIRSAPSNSARSRVDAEFSTWVRSLSKLCMVDNPRVQSSCFRQAVLNGLKLNEFQIAAEALYADDIDYDEDDTDYDEGDVIVEEIAKIGAWTVTYNNDEVGCFAAANYQSRTHFVIGRTAPDGIWTVTVTNPNWSFIKADDDYETIYLFDGRRGWKGTDTGIANGLTSTGLKDEFIEDFARSSTLEIRLQGKRIDAFSLKGTRAAVNAVKECYASKIEKADPFAHSDGDTSIEGTWAKSLAACPEPESEGNYDSVRVTKGGFQYTAGEGLACEFVRGDSSDPHRWIMRGECGEEGDEDRPVVQVDLAVKSGILRIKVAGYVADDKLSFAFKCAANVATSAAIREPSFAEFPSRAYYRGKPVFPQFDGRDREFRDFRTRIRNVITEGPNFSGKYSVILFGCGTGCLFVFVADNSTGEMFDFPRGGEYNYNMQVKFSIDSRLIAVQWIDLEADDDSACKREYFVWEGREAKLLSAIDIGPDEECYAAFGNP